MYDILSICMSMCTCISMSIMICSILMTNSIGGINISCLNNIGMVIY